MVEDAKFEDGGERPLFLKGLDVDDLKVISALAQDAVVPMGEISYDASRRRFALLVNRFRWEDVEAAEKRGRPVERVQAVLVFDDVMAARSSGVPADDKEMILSILALSFIPAEDGMGTVEITLAGDGEIALDVEALDVTLKDVTRPYVAPSKHIPTHDD
ncbi:DUF2948 family protein [Celeribacter halophilus]|jgi:hypothetical protein|uniref:DUF2948 family protein n=1 Tax=Celeribacter halophilus TaxID=576117 RepID=A0AAW7XTC6_9RHOB|nr:DUF2948 family protein [Celeribacter halophilus]MDO6457562.1 DUF2948 family protein [Celeribacter halophilus]MDO6722380.1 DUF2948 family protein [Celeribacter halophilus]